MDDDTMELGISPEQAAKNYNYIGTVVDESPEKIQLNNFLEYIDPIGNAALDEVDRELNLPYKTAPFQHQRNDHQEECGAGGGVWRGQDGRAPEGITGAPQDRG